MKDIFKTVNEYASAEIVEKKSKFIGYIKPVETEQEALEFIQMIKKKHYDARHNCFAYIIDNPSIVRFSDDGEPSQTAGKPMLDVLEGNGLKNVVVVVTRYFGGILLGTGGLVRAYSKATKEAIELAKIVEMKTYTEMEISTDYGFLGKIQYIITTKNVITIDTEYTDIVKFYVYVIKEETQDFIDEIINITNNTCNIIKKGQHYLKTIDNKVVL